MGSGKTGRDYKQICHILFLRITLSNNILNIRWSGVVVTSYSLNYSFICIFIIFQNKEIKRKKVVYQKVRFGQKIRKRDPQCLKAWRKSSVISFFSVSLSQLCSAGSTVALRSVFLLFFFSHTAQHVQPSLIRDQTHASCLEVPSLINHWTTVLSS